MFSDSFDREAYVKMVQSKLRLLRTAARVSQSEAAQALGLVRSTYVHYENGTRLLPWEKCLAILFYYMSIPGSRELIRQLNILPKNSDHWPS